MSLVLVLFKYELLHYPLFLMCFLDCFVYLD